MSATADYPTGNNPTYRPVDPVYTIEQIQLRIHNLRDTAEVGDWELAHAEEDALYADVLHSLAVGLIPAHTAPEVADLILTTREIDFKRVMA